MFFHICRDPSYSWQMAERSPAIQLGARFEAALGWASALHRNQARKGSGAPYVAHLLAVCSLVLEAGGNEDEAIAALLHDAVEDQGGRPLLDEIRQRFGEPVAAIVDGCTDAYEIPKPPWRERKEAFVASLSTASPSVRLVVSADKLHNASSTLEDLRREGPAAWERFRGRERAQWYYRAVSAALSQAGESDLTRRLQETVAELSRL